MRTITTTLPIIDKAIWSNDYVLLRQKLLDHCAEVLHQLTTSDVTDGSFNNEMNCEDAKSTGCHDLTKVCKSFVQTILPCLQEMKSLFPSKESNTLFSHLHLVVVNIPPNGRLVC